MRANRKASFVGIRKWDGGGGHSLCTHTRETTKCHGLFHLLHLGRIFQKGVDRGGLVVLCFLCMASTPHDDAVKCCLSVFEMDYETRAWLNNFPDVEGK